MVLHTQSSDQSSNYVVILCLYCMVLLSQHGSNQNENTLLLNSNAHTIMLRYSEVQIVHRVLQLHKF